MATTDTIADVLTRIRNAQLANHRSVLVPVSKSARNLLTVLKCEGFIEGFEVLQKTDEPKTDEPKSGNNVQLKRKKQKSSFESFTVFLKYYESGLPVISVAKRVSKPGQRQYSGVEKLPKVASGLGISIVSTSQGVMSDKEARKKKIGGEVLALVA